MSPSEVLASLGEWILFASIYGLVMLVVASLAARLLRRGTAAQRARVWGFALLTTVAVPVVRQWHAGPSNLEPPPLGSDESGGPPEPSPLFARAFLPRSVAVIAEEEVREEDVRIVADLDAERGVAGDVPPRVRHAGASDDPMDVGGSEPVDRSERADGWVRAVEVLAGVWVLGVVLAWIRLLLGVRNLSLIRKAARASTPSMQRRFLSCREWLGVRRGVDLRIGDGVRSPVLIGGRFATVVLPTEVASALVDQDLDAVFLHELAHAARGDDRARLIERAIVALFWFHPAVRIAARRLDEEREMACDDMAAGAIGSRSSFARSLLRACEVVVAEGARPVLIAPAAFRGRGIGDRVRRLVRSPEPGCPSVLRAASGLLMLGVASAAIGAPDLARPGAFLAGVPGSSQCSLEEVWRSGEHEARVLARYTLPGTSGTPFGRVLLDRTDSASRTRLEGIARARGPVEWVLLVDGVLVTDPEVVSERARLAVDRATSEMAPAAARELRTVFRHFGRG